MLKVRESVNGKFDIVLSDGYRSQLHNKEKAKTKLNGEIQTSNKAANLKVRNKQQLSQRKPKTNEKTSSFSKTRKSLRIAACFDERSSGKGKEDHAKSENGPALVKSRNSGMDSSTLTSDANAVFVTKNDLASLLEVLNNNSSEEIPTLLTNIKETLSDHSQKITSPTDETEAHVQLDVCKGKVNENVERPEKQQEVQSISDPVTQTFPHTTSQVNTTSNVSMEITKPIAMRSSFAIGAPGLVINDAHEDKGERQKMWVKDLETQIREKKERKQKQNQGDFISQVETERTETRGNQIKSNNFFERTVGETSQKKEQLENLINGHARGRGLMSMMLSKDEAERQRKKILEHQKAIELQVEDRKRQKLKERERRLKEDAMENDRLVKERAELQKQFEAEIKKNKEKEEKAKRRAYLLQESISKAYESAQQLKREKRRNRLPKSIQEQENVSTGHNHTNRKLQVNNQNSSSTDNGPNRSTSLTRGRASKQEIVPPLDFSRSFSPSNLHSKPKQSTSLRLSDSTSKISSNPLSVRHVETSYSEHDSLSRTHDLISKWAKEDVGSSYLTDDGDHIYDESLGKFFPTNGEFVPFHRTASATFESQTVSLQDDGEGSDVSGHQDLRYDQPKNRKPLRKCRSIPEVQPNRTSLLREKVTGREGKNSSLSTRRYKEAAGAPQKSVSRQRSKPRINELTTSCRAEDPRNRLKGQKYLTEGNKMSHTPTHLLSHYSLTPHQEKILEQLSTLRKGLLMKDQELQTRIFKINDYEITTK